MSSRAFSGLYRMISGLVALCLLSADIAGAASLIDFPRQEPIGTSISIVVPPAEEQALFRTTITLRQPTDLQRLLDMGVVVVEEGEESAVVLVTSVLLADLARLRFEPVGTDELGSLAQGNKVAYPWLPESLRPSLEQASTVMKERVALESSLSDGDMAALEATAPQFEDSAAELASVLAGLSAEQLAALGDAISTDFDGDGLTDTEEAWWCTDAQVQDTDSDGKIDGLEINTLRQWRSNERSAPPFETPWPNWPPQRTNCPDKDFDSIPNLAERWDLGLNMDLESTDRDRYDDGQEVFGTTYCPGSGNACGYGSLPSANHDGILLFQQLPSWVTAPGNHPLVAALPKLEFEIVSDSNGNNFRIQTATVLTIDNRRIENETKHYSTTKTEGTSTSDTQTQTWENWQEYSKTTELNAQQVDPVFAQSADNLINASNTSVNISQKVNNVSNVSTTTVNQSSLKIKNITQITKSAGAPAYLASKAADAADFVLGEMADELELKKYVGSAARATARTIWNYPNIIYQSTTPNKCAQDFLSRLKCTAKAVGTQWKSTFDARVAEVEEQEARELMAGNSLASDGAYMDVTRMVPITFPAPQFTPTQTETTGSSTGGARSTTHTKYEEYSVTEGTSKQFGQEWGTATAENSVHAADLWFAYQIRNIGTDYARQICNIAINIYIGDDEIPAATYYPASDIGGNGCLANYRPDELHRYSFPTGSRIALTLEQLKIIDLGGPVRFVIEDFSLGQDDFYTDDAFDAGLSVLLSDGPSDGDDSTESYMMPVWEGDTILDVISRYFPQEVDENGTLIAIWTPEYRPDTPGWCREPRSVGTGSQRTLWCKHALSTADWWNVYTADLETGTEGYEDTPASPGGVVLFRFNLDTDSDGYSDRTENGLGTDPTDPSDAPLPVVIAGTHNVQSGNTVESTISLLNTGLDDAFGVEAVIVAPDDSIEIIKNTVGGSGRVRSGQNVIVGSRFELQSPLPSSWLQAGHAIPTVVGYYIGTTDRTYTFTVNCPDVGGCHVGSGNWTIAWNDGQGANGSINLGSTYKSPTSLAAGTQGLQLALLTGTTKNGESFTVRALTPRDTFQYTITRQPHTSPLVLVRYNDMNGTHQFMISPDAPVLTTPSESLAGYGGYMLSNPGLEIVTTGAYQTGPNNTDVLLNNPSSLTLQNGHVFLEFIDEEGNVVAEVRQHADALPGPTIVNVPWTTNDFSPAYDATEAYLVMAIWTDYEGNIVSSVARPLISFQEDPTAVLAFDNTDLSWNFGAAAQGTLLQRRIVLGSTGYQSLLTHIGGATGITVNSPAESDLPPADMGIYTLQINTADLPVGSYSASIPVRTSDPEHPEAMLTIQGTIEPFAPDSGAGGVQRPLDWKAPFPGTGTVGQKVTYTHPLGPNPETLHPVRVWREDYGQLWGVGNYATDFLTGTAPGDMFGDGRDGVMPASGNLNVTNGVGFATVNGTVNTTSITVENRNAIERVQPGDVVLIHQTQGTGAGNWELNKAANDFTGNGTFTLQKPLRYTYSTGGSNIAQIMRVPQYSACNVTGTVTPLVPWNGAYGGIVAIMCNTTLSVNGAINATGTGYRGGERRVNNEPDFNRGHTGEGYLGFYNAIDIDCWGQNNSRGNGGGSGHGWVIGWGTERYSSGGGGGSYQTAGGGGMCSTLTDRCWCAGGGASSVGYSNLASVFFGGGGGGGGAGYEGWEDGRAGGDGGGFIFVSARNINVSGNLQANGTAGETVFGSYEHTGASGGGGAGGAIYLRGSTISMNPGATSAIGGSGGTQNSHGFGGGAGGTGRIYLEYCEGYSGVANPSATTYKLNCYIVEQVQISGFKQGALTLPESFTNGRTYAIQYGRRFVHTAAGNQDSYLQVPAGAFSNATMQALISGVGTGSLTFKIDVGNDGTWEWTPPAQNVTNAVQLNIPDLSGAFNAYWSSHGAPSTGTLDVPVRVYLSKPGQVLLTDLQMTGGNSRLRFVRARAETYADVFLNMAVGQGGSGNVTIAADVGDNGSVDWTWTGTYPATRTTVDLADKFNEYLAGETGDVDVPVRFFLPAEVGFNLTGATLTPSGQSDATLTSSDIIFGASNPVEGDLTTVTATLHNTGNRDSDGVTAAFFATLPGSSQEWYIGSAYVGNIPANGAQDAQIEWDTLGFNSATTVRVQIDPYDRLDESAEGNNQASKPITIRKRPDLNVAVPAADLTLSDPEPVAGQTVAVDVKVINSGQATAAAAQCALYDGLPAEGGTLIQSKTCGPVNGNGNTTISFAWTPATTGEHRLFLVLDTANIVKESDESNNEEWRDVYVGFAGSIAIDSGTAGDVAYSAAVGYGAVDDNGTTDTFRTCAGSGPAYNYRRDAAGTVTYRFDHLLPAAANSSGGHYYHLDLILYECDDYNRQEVISIDGIPVLPDNETVDLSDGEPKLVSLLIDPAFYADHSIVVTVSGVDPLLGAVVSAISVHTVDYRYADAGNQAKDPLYPAGAPLPYGWLDNGELYARNNLGVLPHQTLRQDLGDNAVEYQFDALDPVRNYQVKLTLYNGPTTSTQEQVYIDQIDLGIVPIPAGPTATSMTFVVPLSAYQPDSSIIVKVTRSGGPPFINEIALEEVTQTTATPCPPPTITSFTPTSGSAGTIVTINGTNLTGATSVTFNGTTATTFNVISATQMTAVVPAGATTGKVTVTTGCGTIAGTADFTVTVPPPTIANFTPTSGSAGTNVTINGTNLTGATSVTFNGNTATTFNVVSATQMTAVVPNGVTSGKIAVTTPGGTATSSTNFTVTAPQPTIANFTPTSGQVGTTVTINGTNLTGATSVTFNGTTATIFNVVSSTQMTAVVPNGATSGKIAVTTPGGTATSSTNFTVTASQPTITTFTPTSGPVGTTLTINGTYLTGATGVTFNTTAATTFNVASATQMTAVVPAGATSGKIAVTTPGGTATSTNNFTVTCSPPTITSISPTSGPVGTTVTIYGTNLTAGATGVTFNGTTVTTFNVVSATQMTAVVPAGATSGKIAVTTPCGTAASQADFTVTPITTVGPVELLLQPWRLEAPSDSDEADQVIDPNVLRNRDTVRVTYNLHSLMALPGDASAIVFEQNGWRFVGLSGYGQNGLNGVQSVDIPLSDFPNLDLAQPVGSLRARFWSTGPFVVDILSVVVYKASEGPPPPMPTVTTFSPTSGPVGSSVTINGTNFTGATRVTFNGTPATTFNIVSATQMTAVIPTGATTGKIGVTTPGGLGTSAMNFTVTTDSSSLTLNPIADAYTSSSAPTSNYGAALTLRVKEASADMYSFLKFDASTLSCVQVESATLRLYVTDAGPNAGSAYSVASGWAEGTINWNNDPAIGGSPLDIPGAAALNTWVEFDVTNGVTLDAPFSFGLKGNASDVVYYASRETANKPQLVIDYTLLPGGAPTAGFTADPLTGIAPLAVAFTNTSTGCPTDFLWDFGDDTTSTAVNPTHTYDEPGTYTVSLTASNGQGSDPEVKTGYITVSEAPPEPDVFVSPSSSPVLGGITAAPADILRYEKGANRWTMVYDGSAHNTNKNLAAFDIRDDGSVLLVFAAGQALTINGATVTATPYDVVQFTPATPGVFPLGPGTFDWFFQGKPQGLTTTYENIDAIDISGDRLLISTTGAAKVPRANGTVLAAADEDVFVFNLTSGQWESSLLIDGSLIPGMGGEDLTSLWDDPDSGEYYITITGAFNLGGVKGGSKSIVKLTPNGGSTVFTPSLVPWLAPGATFPSNLDGLSMVN